LKDQRNLLREVHAITPNEIEALAYVPADSPWFLGHFPNEPILPGIALINMAQQAIIEDAALKGEEIIFEALKRVRFTQPVRPGESLKVNITCEEADAETLFTFKVAHEENIVCSGMIAAKKKKRKHIKEEKDA
jgi:3-hydroxymyristoyl/3-hydroxydecanoyl-(acyl carrier protein) dehydratase